MVERNRGTRGTRATKRLRCGFWACGVELGANAGLLPMGVWDLVGCVARTSSEEDGCWWQLVFRAQGAHQVGYQAGLEIECGGTGPIMVGSTWRGCIGLMALVRGMTSKSRSWMGWKVGEAGRGAWARCKKNCWTRLERESLSAEFGVSTGAGRAVNPSHFGYLPRWPSVQRSGAALGVAAAPRSVGQ